MKIRQRGVAMLTAIILVAIATIVATAILWQSELSARRAAAVFTVAQSLALAEGAEALAGYALKTSRQNSPLLTAPNQDWAKPYGPGSAALWPRPRRSTAYSVQSSGRALATACQQAALAVMPCTASTGRGPWPQDSTRSVPPVTSAS